MGINTVRHNYLSKKNKNFPVTNFTIRGRKRERKRKDVFFLLKGGHVSRLMNKGRHRIPLTFLFPYSSIFLYFLYIFFSILSLHTSFFTSSYFPHLHWQQYSFSMQDGKNTMLWQKWDEERAMDCRGRSEAAWLYSETRPWEMADTSQKCRYLLHSFLLSFFFFFFFFFFFKRRIWKYIYIF